MTLFSLRSWGVESVYWQPPFRVRSSTGKVKCGPACHLSTVAKEIKKKKADIKQMGQVKR